MLRTSENKQQLIPREKLTQTEQIIIFLAYVFECVLCVLLISYTGLGIAALATEWHNDCMLALNACTIFIVLTAASWLCLMIYSSCHTITEETKDQFIVYERLQVIHWVMKVISMIWSFATIFVAKECSSIYLFKIAVSYYVVILTYILGCLVTICICFKK